MTCLCFSDSHGVKRNMRYALNKHKDAEVVFFLGDGISDIEEFILSEPSRAWIVVRGNCDHHSFVGSREVSKLESITLSGKRIVATHGDLYGVKYGFDGALRLAENTGADIVLYGHTHAATEKYFSTEGGGVYLFNPGSVGGVHSPISYGVITISDTGPLFSIMTLE